MVNEQDKFKAITEEVRSRWMSCLSNSFPSSWTQPSLRCLDTKQWRTITLERSTTMLGCRFAELHNSCGCPMNKIFKIL